jgi:hypothetical protein
VTGVRAEKLPARGIDGGRRWLPRRLRENGEEGVLLGNTRPCEVHRGLGNLGEWSAGGERERGCELTAAEMAGGAAGMAHGGEKGAASIGALALGDDW